MRHSSLKYLMTVGLTLATSLLFASGGQATGSLQAQAVKGAPVGALDGSGVPLKIRIGGSNGIPVDAPAVALNVTVVDAVAPASGGYVTVYPCGDLPEASSLNFVTGQTIPNSVITPMSAFGDVCFYVFGTANLIIDASGYLPATSGFVSLDSPQRIVNTRGGNRFGTTSTRGVSIERVQIAGAKTFNGAVTGLPSSGIGAVAVNITAVEGFDKEGYGYVTAYPCASTTSETPDASNVNFSAGETTANSAIVPVSSDGYACFYVYGDTDLLVDASGYFPTSSEFTALSSPKRLVDTRNGNRFGTTSTGGRSVTRVAIAGAKTFRGADTGLPSTGISAVSLNVTAAEGYDKEGYGYVTAYPCASDTTTIPNVSNLNFARGETIPNSVVVPVSADGYTCFYVYGNTDLLIDANGWTSTNGFSPLTAGPVRLRDTREDATRGANALSFDFDGVSAVGVANSSITTRSVLAGLSTQSLGGQRKIMAVTPSNLVGITDQGVIQSLITNGTAQVDHLLTAPDGSVFALFKTPVDLTGNALPDSKTCLLARIDTETGIPACVDYDITQFFWDESFRPSFNEPIQFDDAGNVYYSAIIAPNRSMEFRKWNPATNEITSLLDVTDFDLTTHADGSPSKGVTIYNFLTRGTGQTFITGFADVCDFGANPTDPPNAPGETSPALGQARTPVVDCYKYGYFIYMIDAAGTIRKLPADNPSQFFKVFPDGNIYGTYDGLVGGGIYQWDNEADTWATAPYSSANFSGGQGVQQALAYHVVNNKVLAINTVMGDQTTWRATYVYPDTLNEITLAIKTQPISLTVGNYVALTGKDGDGKNVSTLIDASGTTPIETIIIGAGASEAERQIDVAITEVSYISESNQILFSGTRVSDGKSVVGTYLIATNKLTINTTGDAGEITDISPIEPEPVQPDDLVG